MIVSAVVLAGMVGMTGCDNAKKSTVVTPAIDLNNFDTSVNLKDDFYHFVNGGWMKNNPLKPEYSRYGVFDKLIFDNLDQIRNVVNEVAEMPQTQGSIPQKITTLYNMGMDSVKLNADGAAPIMDQLAEINAVNDAQELSAMVAKMHKEGIFPYFILFVDADEMNSSMNIATLYQGGLNMGDRDYYLSEENSAIRDAYKKYIHGLFTLAGYDEEYANEAVNSVMKIENKIAEVSYNRELLRDPYKNYHKMNGSEWIAANDFIDWANYFNVMGIDTDKDIVVKQTDFFRGLSENMTDVSLDDQKRYLQYYVINEAAPYLSDAFAETSFEFFGRTMSGKEEMQPRWRRALNTTDSALSEALGQMYVEKYFPASSKEKMLELVGNLQAALQERIESLDWMSDETKARAKEKLASFHVKIGYPNKWRDYSNLDIQNDSYWANILRINRFEMDEMLSHNGQPVDKDKWHMSPQMVNAYYNPTTNEICFPAGILQPPFFNPDADDAVNYGAIGVVIGHEMTHGFDDQGCNYDKDGNLNNWWQPEDAERFKEQTTLLANQFNAIEVAPGVYANGFYTLGENIADQGGLIIARLAYENSLKGKERPEPIDGYTDAQRFYLAYATLWAQNIRQEEILRLTKIDPHSLGEWRVNATLRNIDDFLNTFDIQEGNLMYLAPEDRVVIW